MNELKFHHFGIACLDIEAEAQIYAALGYVPESADWIDIDIGVKGRFLVGGGPRLELLEATEGSEVLEPWLKGGSRIYQQAFETADLDKQVEHFESLRARVILEPTSTVAFDGRRICFLMLRNMALIELIDSE